MPAIFQSGLGSSIDEGNPFLEVFWGDASVVDGGVLIPQTANAALIGAWWSQAIVTVGDLISWNLAVPVGDYIIYIQGLQDAAVGSNHDMLLDGVGFASFDWWGNGVSNNSFIQSAPVTIINETFLLGSLTVARNPGSLSEQLLINRFWFEPV